MLAIHGTSNQSFEKLESIKHEAYMKSNLTQCSSRYLILIGLSSCLLNEPTFDRIDYRGHTYFTLTSILIDKVTGRADRVFVPCGEEEAPMARSGPVPVRTRI